jgi:hypothetical protein
MIRPPTDSPPVQPGSPGRLAALGALPCRRVYRAASFLIALLATAVAWPNDGGMTLPYLILPTVEVPRWLSARLHSNRVMPER